MNLFQTIKLSLCVSATLAVSLLGAPHIADASDTVTASAAVQQETDWAKRLRETSVQQNQPVLLVVHTATDCSYCKRWDSTFGGKGEFVKYAKSHPGVQMAVVERPAITTPERSNDYPENVRWLYSANEQRDALRPGTPLFEVFVGQKLVYKSYGTASWDSAVLPAVKELDSRRGVTSVSSLN